MKAQTTRDCPTCQGQGFIFITDTSDGLARGSEIIAETAIKHMLTLPALLGPSRSAKLVAARREAAQRMRQETSLTLKAIGYLLGGRDHSTVINLLRIA